MSGIKSLPMVEARKLKGARRCFRPGRENTSVRISAKRRRMRFHLRRSVPHGSSQGRFWCCQESLYHGCPALCRRIAGRFYCSGTTASISRSSFPALMVVWVWPLGQSCTWPGSAAASDPFRMRFTPPRRKTGGPSSLFIAPAPPPASASPHPLR